MYLERILGGKKNRLKSMAIEIFKTAALSRSAIPPAWSPKERWARLMFRLASRPRFKGPAERRLVVTITIADANRWLVL